MWQCKKCFESVEDSFEVCWNCGTSQDGVLDPDFRKLADLEERGKSPDEDTAQRAGLSFPLPTSCPDCGGTIGEITLFGRGPENPLSGAAIDAAVVYYSSAKAARSPWLSMLEVEGQVRSMMCRECGRIFLYGAPDEQN